MVLWYRASAVEDRPGQLRRRTGGEGLLLWVRDESGVSLLESESGVVSWSRSRSRSCQESSLLGVWRNRVGVGVAYARSRESHTLESESGVGSAESESEWRTLA